jgi:dolichol-phosphate mannosyltransferase
MAGPVPASPPKVTVILATLNEGGNLPELFRRLDASLPGSREVLVLDDGSKDGSREFLEGVRAKDPRLRLIYHDAPQTTLRAHLLGIQAARGEAVVIMDADLQHPPETLPALLAKLDEGYDVAVASRYVKGGDVGDRPARRALISRGAEMLASLMLQSARGLHDPLSGYFAFRRSRVPPIDPSARGFKVLLYVLASSPPLRTTEVGFHFEPRTSGESKVVQGGAFLRTYLKELRRARRIEKATRKRLRSSSGG